MTTNTDSLAEVLGRTEAERERTRDDAGERDLSINVWIQRLQGLAKQAHGLCRAGDQNAEVQTWVELAAVAVARAEVLTDRLAEESEAVNANADRAANKT